MESGNRIESHDGHPLAIKKIEYTHQLKTVCDLNVEGSHSYFVGCNELWVHNANCPPPGTPPHEVDLGMDPAVGKWRGNERDTALRVEQKEGVSPERYRPGPPPDKGDWIDKATGKVYDGCDPAPTAFFDRDRRCCMNVADTRS